MVSSHGKNQLVLLHFLGGNFRVYLELRRVTRQENIMPWRLAPTLVRRLTAFSRGALGFSSRTKLGSKGKLHVSAEVSSNIYKLYQIISNYNIWYQSEWVLLFSEDNIGISCEFALLETMFWFCSDHSGWNSSKAKKNENKILLDFFSLGRLGRLRCRLRKTTTHVLNSSSWSTVRSVQ